MIQSALATVEVGGVRSLVKTGNRREADIAADGIGQGQRFRQPCGRGLRCTEEATGARNGS